MNYRSLILIGMVALMSMMPSYLVPMPGVDRVAAMVKNTKLENCLMVGKASLSFWAAALAGVGCYALTTKYSNDLGAAFNEARSKKTFKPLIKPMSDMVMAVGLTVGLGILSYYAGSSAYQDFQSL